MRLKRSMPSHQAESPAKKQSKWSAEEDSLIIELRGRQMKWEDISKRLPGRSAISCRLHYQNYLERRSEWDEERKNKLARIYERFKPEMWAKVAEEMAVPWRAAEAMHWQLGEADMARRAGVIPFSLSSGSTEVTSTSSNQRNCPSRSRSHSQPQTLTQNMTVDSRMPLQFSSPPTSQIHNFVHINSPSPQPSNLCHKQGSGHISSNFNTAIRRESTPRSVPPASPSEGIALAAITCSRRGGGHQMLPSVAEMTTGVSPYLTPAYSTSEAEEYLSLSSASPSIGMMKIPHLTNHRHQKWPEPNTRQDPAAGFHDMKR